MIESELLNDVDVVEDGWNIDRVIRSIVDSRNQTNAFYVLDVARIVKKHRDWVRKMPRVSPYFAIKCNPDPTVINVLALLNGNFDCASKEEIRQVLATGRVTGDRIIFANPAKASTDIRYARKVGVDKMTVDGQEEIRKIKDIFPTAKLLIRVRNDGIMNTQTSVMLGEKFGCDAVTQAPLLVRLIKEMGMTLHGFSFHAGSPCTDTAAFAKGIRLCSELIDYSRSLGLKDVRVIDIGGGFMGLKDEELEAVATAVNGALEDIDPSSIDVISEPGRYYVESAFTLATLVHSKREIVTEGAPMKQFYYVNDGCFGSFIEELLFRKNRVPGKLRGGDGGDSTDTLCLSTVWGPTCDSSDFIVKDKYLPKFSVGEWMIWKNMGAYTIALASPFNGIPIPDVYPFIRTSDTKVLKAAIDELHSSPTTMRIESCDGGGGGGGDA